MLDLFAHHVVVDLPPRYQLRGRVAGNRVFQLSEPSERCDISVLPRQIRERHFLVGDKSDGRRLAFLPRSLQIPKDCHDAVIVGEVGNHSDLPDALSRPGSRWHGRRPTEPDTLPIEECAKFHRSIRGTWENALRLVPERYDGDVLAQTGLRPPQIGAIHAVKAHWVVSSDPATVVMPTGTGKTETMLSLLISEPIERLLVVVPTDALRTQLGMKFVELGVLKRMGCLDAKAAYPIVGIMKRGPKTPEEVDQLFLRAQVVVTTMASLSLIPVELQARIAEHVSHLFVDEAHHIGADTWKALKTRFIHRKRPIIQFTATPYRNDNRRVDGRFIFSYPLRRAQADRLFTPIAYEPVFDVRQDRADLAIIQRMGEVLRRDDDEGYLHLAMARTDTIQRAQKLLGLYREHLRDYPSALVHNKMPAPERAATVEALRAGRIRIIVCVNMLGEGFDLPRLKVAGLHDRQASETITLQFIGRFTRSQQGLGSATVIAPVSLKDPREWLNSLYREDADWNHLLQVRSAFKTDRQRRREDFYVGLDAHFENIPEETVAPRLSTFVFRTNCAKWHPENLTKLEKAKALIVEDPVINPDLGLVMMVMRHESKLRWARVNAPADVVYNLILAHWDAKRDLRYVHSSTVDGIQTEVAKLLAGDDVTVLGGENVFRVLHGFRRIMLSNLGVKETDAKPVRFQLSSGIDITGQLEAMADNRTRVKTNMFGTGFVDEPLFPDEEDEAVEPTKRSIGCSTKGKVWSAPSTRWHRPYGWRSTATDAQRSGDQAASGAPATSAQVEGLGAGCAVIGCGAVIVAEVEEVGDRVMDRQKALHLSGRFEALHLPLASPGRLVRVLGPVVDALVLAMLHPRHDGPLDASISREPCMRAIELKTTGGPEQRKLVEQPVPVPGKEDYSCSRSRRGSTSPIRCGGGGTPVRPRPRCQSYWGARCAALSPKWVMASAAGKSASA